MGGIYRTEERITRTLNSILKPNVLNNGHLVFNLRSKLDAAGFYDEFEVNRVVEVELDPKAIRPLSRRIINE